MNELIKELFQKSGGIVEVCDVTQDEVLTYTHEMDVEKFAQLIVKECAGVAGCNAHVSGFALGDLIEEHFGVK